MENTNSPMLSPAEVFKANVQIEINRTKMPVAKMIFLGIFAGMFIALGAEGSSVAMHNIANVGMARTIAGSIFPIGLMLIVLLGGELFTGDCLLIMGVLDKKIKVLSMIRILIIVFISNLIGAVIIAYLVFLSGQFGYSNNLLGAFTIKVAMGKINLGFTKAFTSGILCNIFVCGAVLMATAAKDVTGKIFACFFPILVFVVSGFEHCVANMYYIPAGIIASGNEAYKAKAMEAYGYTAEQLSGLNWKSFFINSSIPVTLGNIVGGMVCIGLLFWLIYGKKYDKSVKNLTSD